MIVAPCGSMKKLIAYSGHKAQACEANRVFDLNNVADKSPEEALRMLEEANDIDDMDELRDVS